MTIKYRTFDFTTEDIRPIHKLFYITYGNKVDPAVWRWKYDRNPKSSDIKIFVAENEGRIIAATTRIPADLKIGEDICRINFCVDSLVDLEFRRRGIMTSLYKYAADSMPILYSKGTNPGMYNLLINFGYRNVTPNTYMVKYLSLTKLLFNKVKIYHQKAAPASSAFDTGDFKVIESFSKEFDEFWNRISCYYPGVIVKDSRYMNWRYKEIPHRTYNAFYGMREGKIVSVIILRSRGRSSGSVADILWDPQEKDEPLNSIKFSIDYFKYLGFLKVTFWGTLGTLREDFRKHGFLTQKETPRFSVYIREGMRDSFADGKNIHFVDGDGDSEYL